MRRPRIDGAAVRAQLRLLPIALGIAVLAGSASAVFLVSLDWATAARVAHPWLLALLPFAGFAVGWVYLRYGRTVERGSNLLIDEIHDPTQAIPLRMAPMVLGGTLISHLFGASVGREGTAVQMGGALADQFTPLLRLGPANRSVVLMAGISAGFASVFGTPLAGAVFGLEVLALGRVRFDAVLPCLLAAFMADRVTLAWGVYHTAYAQPALPPWSPLGLAAMMAAGVAFGLTGRGFASATHALTAWMRTRFSYAPMRPLVGGAVVAVTAWAFGLERFLGLGMPTIVQAFEQPLPVLDFAGKLAFTVASLGSGFKGGEVTPLFFIGATLGNALAPLLHLPLALVAAVGFAAVFGGAARTPIASTIMAMELFGAGLGVYAAIGCVVAYLCAGPVGIYPAQRRQVAAATPAE